MICMWSRAEDAWSQKGPTTIVDDLYRLWVRWGGLWCATAHALALAAANATCKCKRYYAVTPAFTTRATMAEAM